MGEFVTTLLDLVGTLLVAAGVGFALAVVSPAGGLVAAGAVLLVARWLIDRPSRAVK